jgi:hypothetical protein
LWPKAIIENPILGDPVSSKIGDFNGLLAGQNK